MFSLRCIVRAASAALAATTLTFPRKYIIGLFAGLALVGATGQLAAATMQVTYTGTITSGWDTAGVFGTVNTDLAGASYTAVYLFDTTKGITYSDDTAVYALGGSPYGADTPALSAVLTIAGNSVAFGSDWVGQIYGTRTEHQHLVRSLNGHDSQLFNAILSRSAATLPLSITTPFVFTVLSPGPDSSVGDFHIFDTGGGFYTAFGTLHPETLTVSDVSAVPLPAALPLFATVLAGGGLIAWRRKGRQRRSRLNLPNF